jgi:hypothetical protein
VVVVDVGASVVGGIVVVVVVVVVVGGAVVDVVEVVVLLVLGDVVAGSVLTGGVDWVSPRSVHAPTTSSRPAPSSVPTTLTSPR